MYYIFSVYRLPMNSSIFNIGLFNHVQARRRRLENTLPDNPPQTSTYARLLVPTRLQASPARRRKDLRQRISDVFFHLIGIDAETVREGERAGERLSVAAYTVCTGN